MREKVRRGTSVRKVTRRGACWGPRMGWSGRGEGAEVFEGDRFEEVGVLVKRGGRLTCWWSGAFAGSFLSGRSRGG